MKDGVEAESAGPVFNKASALRDVQALAAWIDAHPALTDAVTELSDQLVTLDASPDVAARHAIANASPSNGCGTARITSAMPSPMSTIVASLNTAQTLADLRRAALPLVNAVRHGSPTS